MTAPRIAQPRAIAPRAYRTRAVAAILAGLVLATALLIPPTNASAGAQSDLQSVTEARSVTVHYHTPGRYQLHADHGVNMTAPGDIDSSTDGEPRVIGLEIVQRAASVPGMIRATWPGATVFLRPWHGLVPAGMAPPPIAPPPRAG